ncbi:MAG: DUF4392 domain-containing protein [Planctomycetota bacterium]|nr:DUF4392 domain-containing protein [Planctomycetota bacterium]
MKNAPRFFSELEAHIQQDPGKRGLGGAAPSPFSLTRGSLQKASEALFHQGKKIALLTGFTIPDSQPPAPETDGPLGTVILAQICQSLGKEVIILCDERHEHLLQRSLEARQLKQATIPYGPQAKDWCAKFLKNEQPSHVISIEHVGPSYDSETIPPAYREAFLGSVPLEKHGQCQNMGGTLLGDLATEAFHLWADSTVTSIAVGDGGNELGMGSLPWPVLAENISNALGGQIACRIPCDHLIVAGISNWGAYALGLALIYLSESPELSLDIEDQEALLGELLQRGAIDGVTKREEASIDGLPWSHHKEWLGQALSLLNDFR